MVHSNDNNNSTQSDRPTLQKEKHLVQEAQKCRSKMKMIRVMMNNLMCTFMSLFSDLVILNRLINIC